MRAVLADTGPLYAAADVDDSYHLQAQQELSRLAREGLAVVVVFPTLLECYSLVLRRLSAQTAQRWLQDVRAGAILVNPTIEDYGAAAALLQHYADQPITLFDAVAAVVGTRMSVPIWTYDHHFDLMPSSVWR